LEILTNDFSTQERESFMIRESRTRIPLGYKLDPNYRAIFVASTEHIRNDIVADGHFPDSIEVISVYNGRPARREISQLLDWTCETMYRIQAEGEVPF
jgi:hypothetical protein